MVLNKPASEYGKANPRIVIQATNGGNVTMETAETKKLTTKDMARAENDKTAFLHDKQEQEQQREAEARDDIEQRTPAQSPATNGESPSPLLSADQGKD